MKCALAICAVLVAVLALTSAVPAKGSTKASLKKPCLKTCPQEDEIKPICGGNAEKKISFANECVMSNYNCENGADLKVISQGECPGGGGIRLS
ncbi:uncharacterized protein LOC123315754 [Coccinella septempunctata]|uniref:uncharacterized protein LOC123315754 n=1 Tax=Coccinella septempunctata TaxID=41139 RepID=UPI001D07C32A|nr:uncharacterized protein LOC123315754 [Coccinella septempunctata]